MVMVLVREHPHRSGGLDTQERQMEEMVRDKWTPDTNIHS